MSIDVVNKLQDTADNGRERELPPANARQRAKQFVMDLQDEICQTLEQLDGETRFQEDNWERGEGGGGRMGNDKGISNSIVGDGMWSLI